LRYHWEMMDRLGEELTKSAYRLAGSQF
jgi:hypothetical protein